MFSKAIRTLLGICGGASLAGVLALAGDAHAVTVNQHGTSLRGQTGSMQGCFIYDYTGFYRGSTTGSCSGNVTAVAPVIFIPPDNAGNKYVYVDGTCNNNKAIDVAVWSIDYNGTLLGSHSGSVTGTPSNELTLTFSSSETAYWGYMHMYTQWGATVSGLNCRIFGFDVSA